MTTETTADQNPHSADVLQEAGHDVQDCARAVLDRLDRKLARMDVARKRDAEKLKRSFWQRYVLDHVSF